MIAICSYSTSPIPDGKCNKWDSSGFLEICNTLKAMLKPLATFVKGNFRLVVLFLFACLNGALSDFRYTSALSFHVVVSAA